MSPSLEASGDQTGGQRPDGERTAGVGEQPGNRGEEQGAHTVVRDADGDGAHDVLRVVAQRHLPAGRAAERPAVDLHDVPARERVARVGGDDLADLLGVGVRPAHPAPVHDDDVLGAGGTSDPFGRGLHRAGGGRGRGEQLLGEPGPGRRALRDGQGTAHRLVVELGAEGRQEEAGGEHGDAGRDGQLHQQYLGEDPLGPDGATCSPGSGWWGHQSYER
ncbi:hypothetical protein GCM10015535_52570 [Streptomyces gelaticus]|uniref:Uncharacterized protein n=1 Tax=Streptomyces gelaticus TaxID=285446 RepID=A0ABQ2W4H9_9ACTN|nr:hypothetical protein GCM10015535_52570 [Streptomyces gelaticus]